MTPEDDEVSCLPLCYCISHLSVSRCLHNFLPSLYKQPWIALRVVYMKQPKLVKFLLFNWFCQSVCLIFLGIWLTDITLHKIRWRDRKIPISKLVKEHVKISWTAWQNQLDMTKIESTTVHVSGALTLYLGMMRQVFYHCSTAAGNLSLWQFFHHFLSRVARGRGWTRTLKRGMARWLFTILLQLLAI